MEAYSERSTIIFYMKSDDFIAKSLTNVSNRQDIRAIVISYSVIGSLNDNYFHGFNNLINLELANCFLYQLDGQLFSNLVHLESINLGNNMINSINEKLFNNNLKLKTITLQNNLLESIPSQAFSLIAAALETLDLSYNKIVQISDTFLTSMNLKTVCLNNNSIAIVNAMAFRGLPNLTHLALEANKIRNLDVRVFKNLHQLQFLNLNENLIYDIVESLFWNCQIIEKIFLANNLLTQNPRDVFLYNSALTDLDLSENMIFYIESNVFKNCGNLKYLKLKVSTFFDINSIKPLKHLIQFELFYLSGPQFRLTKSFWSHFIKPELKILKLVFKHINYITLEQNFQITNLEDLHIECIQPNDHEHDINLSIAFLNVTGLKSLVLKNLNAFSVVKYSNKLSKLTNLNLSGVRNKVFYQVFDGLKLLTHLDLSFSAIEFTSLTTFKDLVNLEYLDFQYSKLIYIKCSVFVNNSKLKFLSFFNCRITLIDDYSFANLCNLEILDLRNNLLSDVSQLVFSGLPNTTDIRI